MNAIQSGTGSQLPPLGIDTQSLDQKTFSQQMHQQAFAGDGNSAINFGLRGSNGTSLDSLNTPSQGAEGQNGELTQAMSQLLTEILKALMPLLQQLMQGQQGSGEQSGAGNTGSGAGMPQNSAGNAFADTGAGAGAGAGSGSGSGSGTGEALATPGTPEMPVLSQAETAHATLPGQEASTTSSPALSTSSGGDLHLPDSLKAYESDIQDAAQATGVPANVLAAQIWQESRGNLSAQTTNGGNGLSDAGLMQVNSNTFADLQNKNPDLLGPNANPNNARDNIMSGALYMKEQLNAFDGNMGAALRAYNSGPNNVNTADLSDISKTNTGDSTYVDKVMGFANTIATGKGTLPA